FPFSDRSTGNNLVINATDAHPNNYEIFQDGFSVNNGTWTNDTLIIYNLDHLPIGNYTFAVLLFDEFFNNDVLFIDVEVFELILKETVSPGITITSTVREGDYETIQGVWKDIFNDAIIDANVTMTLYNGTAQIYIETFLNQTDIDGSFNLLFDYSDLPTGDYRWEVLFEAENYISQILELNFTIVPHDYSIEVAELSELTQGEEYELSVTIFYGNPDSIIMLNSFVGKSGVANDVEVQLFMEIVLLDGTQSNITKSVTSGIDGKAIFSLTIFETSLISSIGSITFEIPSNQFGNEVSFSVSNLNFPTIITNDGSTDIGDPTNGSTNFNLDQNVILIAAGILGLFFLIMVIRSKKKVTQQKELDLQGEYEIALAEVNGLTTIQMIILNSITGIPLYEKRIRTFGIDSVLLSGVTSAISALLQEANDQQIFGLEIMENRGLSITTHKGQNTSLVCISSKSLPMMLLNQFIDSHQAIEKRIEDDLSYLETKLFSDQEISEIFNQTDFKIDLATDLEINLVALENFHSSGKTKNGVKALAEVLLDIDIDGLTITNVKEMLEVFQNRGFEANYAASFILNAYDEGIITSKK
ncbi:MAG: hypothetical protein ACW99Q_25075, partial [Candidatus Kariarchaeaceae archaeon]